MNGSLPSERATPHRRRRTANGRAAQSRLHGRGLRGRRRELGNRRPVDGNRESLRRRRSRRHAAGSRRIRGLPGAASKPSVGHRSSCSPRSTRSTTASAVSTSAPTTISPSRSASRSSRRASARSFDAETTPARRPFEVGELRLDPARHRAWRGSTELALAEGDGPARAVHAPRRRGDHPHPDPRARLGLRVRRALERRRSVRRLPPQEDRQAVRTPRPPDRPRSRLSPRAPRS